MDVQLTEIGTSEKRIISHEGSLERSVGKVQDRKYKRAQGRARMA